MLTLKELLPIVQKKYPEAYIEDETLYLYSDDSEIFIELTNNKIHYLDISSMFNGVDEYFDNIIELKHYLDIEIEWKDLISILPKDIEINECILPKVYFFEFKGYTYNDDGYIFRNDTEKQICLDESFWKQYTIIKALTENEEK